MTLRILLPAILFLAAAVAAPAAAQTYYRWTDDSGTVHFTAQPPADRDYETVTMRMGRLGNADVIVGSQDNTDRDPGEDEVQMPRRAPPDPEAVAARCQQARENLFWLESKQRIRVEGDDGSQRLVDNDERERLIEEARDAVAEWCSDGG